jgi:hypothetical protein
MPVLLLGELPALPLHTAGRYVAAAYVVLFALVLVYVAIMAIRLSRIERQLGELLEFPERTPAGGKDASRAGAPDAEEPGAARMEATHA